MGSRINLNSELVSICPNVYFQAPETLKLTYPCILYDLTGIEQKYADDISYKRTNCYQLTLVERVADSVYTDTILEHFRMCKFDRKYKADGLYHTIFTLYY